MVMLVGGAIHLMEDLQCKSRQSRLMWFGHVREVGREVF